MTGQGALLRPAGFLRRRTIMQLDEDLLNGASEISEFIGQPVRRVYYMCEKKQLPAFKLGSKWTARKSTILARLAKLESGEVDDARAVG
jgi:hypothetical protein